MRLSSKVSYYGKMAGLFFRYLIFRMIEGQGSKKAFRIIFRKFNLYVNFEKKVLFNEARHRVKVNGKRSKISFWLAFREDISIEEIRVNDIIHKNYKLYSIDLPLFAVPVRVNYLVIRGLKIDSQEADVTLKYKIKMGNYRDDFATLIENYIGEDEFHLFYSWYPILGDKLSIKQIMAGEIPQAESSPFEFDIELSRPGIVNGEGQMTRLAENRYKMVNYDNVGNSSETNFCIVGGKLEQVTYRLNNGLKIQFYHRKDINNLDSFTKTMGKGMELIIEKLGHLELDSINIFFIPIIAGGYGLTHSFLINENYLTVPTQGHLFYGSCRLLWHEFIHHWWGNRVSSEGRAKYILIEGMTVLFEWLTAREIFGQDYFEEIIETTKENVLAIRGHDRPIAEANRIPPFGNVVIYEKIPLVLYQLLNLVGEETFINYCHGFLERPGVYEWSDFVEGLEKWSQLDLREFNQYWVETTKLPDRGDDILLVDDRSNGRKRFDEIIVADYLLERDYEGLYNSLLGIEPDSDFSGEYYYYLGLCQEKMGNMDKAMEIYTRIDGKDTRYYGRGLYRLALIYKEVGKESRYQELMSLVAQGPYLFKNARPIYQECRKLDLCS